MDEFHLLLKEEQTAAYSVEIWKRFRKWGGIPTGITPVSYTHLLQLRGVRPFLSNKYDITKHPKYRQLSDYNKRNAFDIEKYRQHKLVVKPDDTFRCV